MIAGPGGVGKTSLVYRFEKNEFIPAITTIGVNFVVKEIEIGGKTLTLSIWDYAGEKRFQDLFPSYAIGTSGSLVCFDVSKQFRMASLNQLPSWIKILREKNGDIPILLVGNKIDLVDADDLVELKDLVQPFIKKYNLQGVYFTSARDGRCVNDVFSNLAYLVGKYHKLF